MPDSRGARGARAQRGNTGNDGRVEDPTLRHGFAIVPGPIMRARDLKPSAKVLYGLLLSYALGKGDCFPGQERLAWDLGVSVRNVQILLNALQSYGLIDWHERLVLGADGREQRRGNIYVIRNWAANPRFRLERYAAAGREDGTACALVSPGEAVVSHAGAAPEISFTQVGEQSCANVAVAGETSFVSEANDSSPEEYPEDNRKQKKTLPSALWLTVQDELRARVSSAVFDAFIRPAKAHLEESDGKKLVVVVAPSSYVRDQLESRVGSDAISAALAAVTGEWCQVCFAGPTESW